MRVWENCEEKHHKLRNHPKKIGTCRSCPRCFAMVGVGKLTVCDLYCAWRCCKIETTYITCSNLRRKVPMVHQKTPKKQPFRINFVSFIFVRLLPMSVWGRILFFGTCHEQIVPIFTPTLGSAAAKQRLMRQQHRLATWEAQWIYVGCFFQVAQ